MANSPGPTPSPEEQQRLARADADIRRHLVMKGLPPTGSTSPMRSDEEHQRRIEKLKNFEYALPMKSVRGSKPTTS